MNSRHNPQQLGVLLIKLNICPDFYLPYINGEDPELPGSFHDPGSLHPDEYRVGRRFS